MGQMRKDFDDLEENGMLGDWCFNQTETDGLHFGFRYPNPNEADRGALVEVYGARGTSIYIPIIEREKLPNRWEWDGNKDAPTISPSIRVMGGENGTDLWHGYFRAGKLETA